MQGLLNGFAPFLDVDNLYDLSSLLETVVQCKALFIVLTKSYLRRPFCVAELVAAHKGGILLIPVVVKDIDREFDFEELWSLTEDNKELLMDDLGWRILEDQGITKASVWDAIKRLREIVALPDSSSVQSAEVEEILEKIRLSNVVSIQNSLEYKL